MSRTSISDRPMSYEVIMETTKLINLQIGRNRFHIEMDPDSNQAHYLREENKEWEALVDKLYEEFFGWERPEV